MALPSATGQALSRTFSAMACHCEVVLHPEQGDERRGQADMQAVIDEVMRIEHKFSRYRDDSVVSRINAAAGGQPVPCDTETWQLLQFAHAMHQASGGLFDITSGVLRRAWGFKEGRLATQEALDSLLPLIGWHEVELGEQTVRLPRPEMQLDFGGFGKEYAADRAGGLLEARGVRHGYVNLGGDIRVVGPKPDGSPWMMGIQHPRQRDRLLAALPVHRGGLATSGDYERYIESNGRRYCHVLHPGTGWPVNHWQSVSVLAPLAIVAGNLTTQAMLMEARGLDLLRSSGMIFLAVDAQGVVHTHRDAPASASSG